MYVYRFQTVFVRCTTLRLHCFLSSHWHSFRFLSFMAFFIPYIQFYFGLPRALLLFWHPLFGQSSFCHSLNTAVPCELVLFIIIVSSSPIFCLIVTFLILSFLDILEDLLRAYISVASTRLLLFYVSLHVSEPYNKLLLMSAL